MSNANLTSDERIRRAVKVLRAADGKSPIANAVAWLKDKGCTDNEIMEALNEASAGTMWNNAV